MGAEPGWAQSHHSLIPRAGICLMVGEFSVYLIGRGKAHSSIIRLLMLPYPVFLGEQIVSSNSSEKGT